MPQACPVEFRPWPEGGKGREGWILDPFCALQERKTIGSPRLVLITLSGCPQNLSCVIWDHIPTKDDYPGTLNLLALETEPRAEPIRSGRNIAELLIGGRMALAVGGAEVPPSHRPRASLQCTACGRSGGPGACAPAAAGGGLGAGCGPACPPSTAARPARVPSCRLNSAVWPPARVSSAKGLLIRRCPAGWGDRKT